MLQRETTFWMNFCLLCRYFLGLWECRLNHMQYFQGLVKQTIKQACLFRSLENFFFFFPIHENIISCKTGNRDTVAVSYCIFTFKRKSKTEMCGFWKSSSSFLSENSFDFWSEMFCYYKVQKPCYSKIQRPLI